MPSKQIEIKKEECPFVIKEEPIKEEKKTIVKEVPAKEEKPVEIES
jgi:hypothetical protein